MRNVLIIDTETTGLDHKVDRAIEVAAILYSVEHATVLRAFSSLIQHGGGNPCEAVNRIPPAALVETWGAGVVWREVAELALVADAFVAHNAEFDRGFTPPDVASMRPWICSKNDIAWPKATKLGGSLVNLALEHDLGVAVAHRAMADCDLLARLFTRCRELGCDLDAMLQRALRPKAEFVALVPFDKKDLAKDAGFTWYPADKQWRRRMFLDDAAALPFRTARVAESVQQ